MYENELFSDWEIVGEPIGTGGFSKVYKIRKDDGVGGEYFSALKVITIPASKDEYRLYVEDGYDDASIATIFKEQVTNIVSEFKMLSEFRGNTNIVSYEDHKVVPQPDGYSWHIFIRMELLTTLPAAYNKKPLTVKDAVKLGIDICNALILCERSNVIHRDIKPQNIFVNKYGDYKLGDFGIARTMDHTTRATKIGTPAYMAPEVFNGGTYNSNVDIYSLGMVLYWLLNERRLPFLPLPPVVPTDAQNNAAQNMRLRGTPLPEPKNGTPALKAAVLKACEFDPTKRFYTATAFKRALEGILAELEGHGLPTPVSAPRPVPNKPSPISPPIVERTSTPTTEEREDKTVRVRPANAAEAEAEDNKTIRVRPASEDTYNEDDTMYADNVFGLEHNEPEEEEEEKVEQILKTRNSAIATLVVCIIAFIILILLSNELPETFLAISLWALAVTGIYSLVRILKNGSSAISTDPRLKSVTIDDKCLVIKAYAFAHKKEIADVFFGKSVVEIGEGAFHTCESLKLIDVPDGIKIIGDYAFSNCISLREVVIGKNVTEIGEEAFSACTSLKEMIYVGTTAEWKSIKKGENWNAACPFKTVMCNDGNVDV